jgi:hypothetical protein
MEGVSLLLIRASFEAFMLVLIKYLPEMYKSCGFLKNILILLIGGSNGDFMLTNTTTCIREKSYKFLENHKTSIHALINIHDP